MAAVMCLLDTPAAPAESDAVREAVTGDYAEAVPGMGGATMMRGDPAVAMLGVAPGPQQEIEVSVGGSPIAAAVKSQQMPPLVIPRMTAPEADGRAAQQVQAQSNIGGGKAKLIGRVSDLAIKQGCTKCASLEKQYKVADRKATANELVAKQKVGSKEENSTIATLHVWEAKAIGYQKSLWTAEAAFLKERRTKMAVHAKKALANLKNQKQKEKAAKKEQRKSKEAEAKANKKFSKANKVASTRYTNGKFGARGGKVQFLKCISPCKGGKSMGGYGWCYVRGHPGRPAWGGCLPPGTMPSKKRRAHSRQKSRLANERTQKRQAMRKELRDSVTAEFKGAILGMKNEQKTIMGKISSWIKAEHDNHKKNRQTANKITGTVVTEYHDTLKSLLEAKIKHLQNDDKRFAVRLQNRKTRWADAVGRRTAAQCRNVLDSVIMMAEVNTVAKGVATKKECQSRAKQCKIVQLQTKAYKVCNTTKW
jgi:hypothetical protein